MRVIGYIYNIQFIKDYLNHFHINKIGIKTVFCIFKNRIECWKNGHSFSTCSIIGNSYVSVCNHCGKRNVFTLMSDNKLFRD